jgi:hypothetical protein
LLVLYVREVAVTIDMGGRWQDDPDARALFSRLEAEAGNVKVNKLYGVSDSPADGCDWNCRSKEFSILRLYL